MPGETLREIVRDLAESDPEYVVLDRFGEFLCDRCVLCEADSAYGKPISHPGTCLRERARAALREPAAAAGWREVTETEPPDEVDVLILPPAFGAFPQRPYVCRFVAGSNRQLKGDLWAPLPARPQQSKDNEQ